MTKCHHVPGPWFGKWEDLIEREKRWRMSDNDYLIDVLDPGVFSMEMAATVASVAINHRDTRKFGIILEKNRNYRRELKRMESKSTPEDAEILSKVESLMYEMSQYFFDFRSEGSGYNNILDSPNTPENVWLETKSNIDAKPATLMIKEGSWRRPNGDAVDYVPTHWRYFP